MISRPSASRRLVRITLHRPPELRKEGPESASTTLSPALDLGPLGVGGSPDEDEPSTGGPGARAARSSPEGIRTLATAVRGRRPGPLDDGALPRDRAPSILPRTPGRAPPGPANAERPRSRGPGAPDA